VLWRRCHAEKEAAGEAEGRQEEDAPVRQGGDSADGIYSGVENGWVVARYNFLKAIGPLRILAALLGFPTLSYIAFSQTLDLPIDLLSAANVASYALLLYWNVLFAFSVVCVVRIAVVSILHTGGVEFFRRRLRYRSKATAAKLSVRPSYRRAAALMLDARSSMEQSIVLNLVSLAIFLLVFFVGNGWPAALTLAPLPVVLTIILSSEGEWSKVEDIRRGSGLLVRHHNPPPLNPSFASFLSWRHPDLWLKGLDFLSDIQRGFMAVRVPAIIALLAFSAWLVGEGKANRLVNSPTTFLKTDDRSICASLVAANESGFYLATRDSVIFMPRDDVKELRTLRQPCEQQA
jgi:hypothetical protein